MSVRVQFELSNQKIRELEALMAESGVKTKSEFINNALTLLEWAIEEKKAGRMIASVDEEGQKYREVLMPLLSTMAR